MINSCKAHVATMFNKKCYMFNCFVLRVHCVSASLIPLLCCNAHNVCCVNIIPQLAMYSLVCKRNMGNG